MRVIQSYSFYKKGEEWWMDLPEWSGDPEDLQMIEGADAWLNLLSNQGEKVKLLLSNDVFEGAENLSLIRIREANFGGGGIYFLENYQHKKVHLKLWLCHVTAFVFGKVPQKIFFKVH
ncbi:MAG: hypothetical protein EOO47_21270 [Flavobacterium sp.]|nr:MAG: hypothetical protein EOO47_21270 [Flavobacterium sp.]